MVSRCFPGGYNVKLYISRGRLAWWLLDFLRCKIKFEFEFVLHCSMKPGLGKGIQCHVWPHSFFSLANHHIADIRPWLVKRAVNLVIAGGHFNLSQGFCVGMYRSTYTLSHPQGLVTSRRGEVHDILYTTAEGVRTDTAWKSHYPPGNHHASHF